MPDQTLPCGAEKRSVASRDEAPDFLWQSDWGRGIVWALAFFIMYLFVYFPLCMRSGLHWDEVFDTAGVANGTYIAAGRWGLALYRYVFGLGYMPWIAGIVAGGYIAAALVLQMNLFEIKSVFARFVYGAFYIGCIQWASQVQYSHQSDAVALALLCVTAAAWLLQRKRRWSAGIAVLLVIYACAVYQTAMLYLLVLLILKFIVADEPFNVMWRGLVRPLGFIFVAGCLYLVSSAVSKNLPIVTSSDMMYVGCVQSSMSKWPEIFSAPTVVGKLSLFAWYTECYIKVIIKNLLGLTYEGQWVYATAVLPLMGLLCYYWRKNKDYARIAGLVIAWIAPFAMVLVVMTDQGPRVSLAEPLALAGMWGFWLKKRNGGSLFRCCVVVFGMVVLLKSAYRCSIIAEDEKNLFASRMENIQTLNSRLMSIADEPCTVGRNVIYFGNFPNQSCNPYRERWGKRRDKQVLLVLPDGRMPEELCMPIRKAGSEEAVLFKQEVGQMPTWPAPGCIRAAGDFIIIRFAD